MTKVYILFDAYDGRPEDLIAYTTKELAETEANKHAPWLDGRPRPDVREFEVIGA